MCVASLSFLFFFFNDTATTEIYTLSLHDALPICVRRIELDGFAVRRCGVGPLLLIGKRAAEADVRVTLFWIEFDGADRKSTRLNSSHSQISYAVFCLKKKKKKKKKKFRITYTM